jgi:hypothetical protein
MHVSQRFLSVPNKCSTTQIRGRCPSMSACQRVSVALGHPWFIMIPSTHDIARSPPQHTCSHGTLVSPNIPMLHIVQTPRGSPSVTERACCFWLRTFASAWPCACKAILFPKRKCTCRTHAYTITYAAAPQYSHALPYWGYQPRQPLCISADMLLLAQ